MRVGVLASGMGSNLAAIIDSGIPVSVVATDRPCGALEIAQQHQIPTELVERDSFGEKFDRAAYTERLIKALETHDLDLIVFAGFMTIVTRELIDRWPGRVLNTHPALLPSFVGGHAVRDTLKAGVKISGVTVHIVTPDVDSGPILAQEPVRVYATDTEEVLHERIKEVERVVYPQTIKEFIEQCQNGL